MPCIASIPYALHRQHPIALESHPPVMPCELGISRHISAYLGISRHISVYLGISRHISAYLGMSLCFLVCLIMSRWVLLCLGIFLCISWYVSVCLGILLGTSLCVSACLYGTLQVPEGLRIVIPHVHEGSPLPCCAASCPCPVGSSPPGLGLELGLGLGVKSTRDPTRCLHSDPIYRVPVGSSTLPLWTYILQASHAPFIIGFMRILHLGLHTCTASRVSVPTHTLTCVCTPS